VVEQATKFDLIIDPTTAQALAIKAPRCGSEMCAFTNDFRVTGPARAVCDNRARKARGFQMR